MGYMIHGHGDQYKFTNTYQAYREKGLRDADDLTTQEKIEMDITGDDGGGRTDPETFTIEVLDTSIRRNPVQRREYDTRKDPRVGD